MRLFYTTVLFLDLSPHLPLRILSLSSGNLHQGQFSFYSEAVVPTGMPSLHMPFLLEHQS